jgi:hypothetical protein
MSLLVSPHSNVAAKVVEVTRTFVAFRNMSMVTRRYQKTTQKNLPKLQDEKETWGKKKHDALCDPTNHVNRGDDYVP